MSVHSYNTGCRCDDCRAYQRQRVAAWRAERLAKGIVKHGIRASYDAGCRCEECVAAAAKGRRTAWRKALERGLDPDDERHGTHYAYTYWGCRCPGCRGPGCRAASTAARKRWREAKQGAA